MDGARIKIAELDQASRADGERLRQVIESISSLCDAKTGLERELAGSAALVSKAGTMATKFEERASVAKHAMNEDFAIAELTKEKDRFGIKGIVHDLVTWDENYERCVLAAGSEWMKAFVVDDVKSMIAIAAYAKEKSCPACA